MGLFHNAPARRSAAKLSIVPLLARRCGSRLPKSSDFRMLLTFLCSFLYRSRSSKLFILTALGSYWDWANGLGRMPNVLNDPEVEIQIAAKGAVRLANPLVNYHFQKNETVPPPDDQYWFKEPVIIPFLPHLKAFMPGIRI